MFVIHYYRNTATTPQKLFDVILEYLPAAWIPLVCASGGGVNAVAE